ncbi:ferredoxin [Candidatus Woesearchaeota archaeon]|jgi:ferredoxin|nr:ferredoxin [Candidatus Woesearchaeota archaeon]|tara:strand:+ start:327 stop:557 length:231 start_codon:yes stop_codon:yes gene_type:complete
MTNYKIEHDIEGCIGCGACTALSDNWELKEIKGEEKADFIKGEITESELEDNKDAAESCPVEIIKIFNKDTGEKIV